MGGRRNEKKKRGRRNSGGKEKKEKGKKKNLPLALNRSGYFCWCPVCAMGGLWLEGLVSLFSLPGPHSLLLFSLQSPLALQLPSAGCSAFVLES